MLGKHATYDRGILCNDHKFKIIIEEYIFYLHKNIVVVPTQHKIRLTEVYRLVWVVHTGLT